MTMPAVLTGGFRPFFFGAAAWALTALILWLLSLSGQVSLPTLFEPLAWHRHEMLFGFVGAAIAGFLLTAVPNWTRRPPLTGWLLAGLFGLWLAARLGVLFSSYFGPVLPAALDAGFFFLLAAFILKELVAAKNRNIPVVVLVSLFGIANLADHAAAAALIARTEIGGEGAIACIVILLSLIGGRIIPAFTRNWLTAQGATGGLPTQANGFDLFVNVTTALSVAAWLADLRVSGALLLAAAALQALRLSRWKGHNCAAEPLLLILHIGYLWLPFGLALIAASELDLAVPRSAGIHALTAGAMATMILAVMARASLGHTGRPLTASACTAMVFLLVTLGAVSRVLAALALVDYTSGMRAAAVAWAAAFLLFLLSFTPVLLRRPVQQA